MHLKSAKNLLLTTPVKKVNVFIAVPSLECGGLERNVAMICNHINTDLFDVSLVVINNRSPFYPITNPHIKITDLQCKNVRSSILRLVKLARATQPDIILSTANHLNLLFALFKRLFPEKTRVIVRESSIVSINSKRAKLAGLYDMLLRIFYRKVDLIVCQSEYMAKDLIQHYHIKKQQTVIINNAVEMPLATAIPDHAKAVTVPQFITVARLSEEKGLDRIIRALALLNIPFHYTIIGEGPARKQLQQLIQSLSLQDQVFLPGSSNQPYALVQQPALFLMGSHYEGFPNVLLEANALGIPVVVYNAPGGIAEVVTHLMNGLLVEDGNEKAFAEAVVTALQTEFDREAIKKATIDKYDPVKIMEQWQQLLTKTAFNPR